MDPVSGVIATGCCVCRWGNWGFNFAILLKTPGTPEAVATTFDGYPMAQRGDAGLALGLAVSASSFGTIFSAICMVISAP